MIEAAELPGWSLSDTDVVVALEELFAARAQLEALLAEQVRQAEARALHAELDAVDTERWLRRRFRLSRREAARMHDLAAALPGCPGTATVLGAGVISAEQATAMTSALEALPVTVTAQERARAEELLVEQAATLDPEELARCGRALREALTTSPDVDDPGEAAWLQAEAEQAERTAQRRHELRTLRLRERADGMGRLDGLLDPMATAAVRAALEARACLQPSDEGVRDERSKNQRMADALHELALIAAAKDGAEAREATGEDPTLVPDLIGRQEQTADSADTAPLPGRLVPPQVSLVVRYETLQPCVPGPACSRTALR